MTVFSHSFIELKAKTIVIVKLKQYSSATLLIGFLIVKIAIVGPLYHLGRGSQS